MPKADVIICPRVGPELIAGSTRLKSATAAKLVLNMLTTTAMIRLGKVYNGWMVDLKPTSRKLRLRAMRMVCHLSRVSPAVAQSLLEGSKNNVKTAVLAGKLKQGSVKERVGKARRLLKAFNGSLAGALNHLPKLES